MSAYDSGGGGFVAPRITPVVKTLVIANAAVWLALLLADIVVRGSMSGAVGALGLRPSSWFVGPPWFPFWQPVTYGFLHAGRGHLFWNMLQLYFFGTLLESILGSRRFLATYVGAMLVGALAHLLLQPLVNANAPAIGASGAVLGVVIATAVLRPNTTVILLFIPVTLKWLAIGIVALDVIGALQGLRGQLDGLARWVHLGGAGFGFLAARRGWVWLDPIERVQRRRERSARSKRISEDEQMDQLLAKISREGMNSLSRSEKAFLKRVSSRR